MGRAQHVGDGISFRRDELEAGHFEQLPVGVAEVDRIHKAAVDRAGVLDAKFLQPRRDLGIGGAGDGEGQVVQVADAPAGWASGR